MLSTSLTTVAASTFAGCTSLETISFVGTPSEALKAAAAAAAPNATITSMTACEAYGHSNMTSLNDCMERCGVCEAIVQKEALKHNKASVIEYANGYASNGTVTYYCTNEGCTFKDIDEELNPLFSCQGYSAPENGNGSLAIGYKVNVDALSTYESLTGKSVAYGVFAVSYDNLKGKNVFENGEAISGAITADLTKYTFASFDLKVTGFAGDNMSKPLAMGAYVAVSDENTTEYSYMQYEQGTPENGYYFVTYNQVAGNTSTKEFA